MRWIKSWSASSEHSCGLYACTKQSRCSLWIYLYKGNLTLPDSHCYIAYIAWLHVYTFTSFCMTICIQILLILLYLNNLPLNLTCTPVFSKPECIIKHFSKLKSISLPNLWPLEQIEQILSQSMHVLLSLNPNRELHVTGKSPHM